MSKIPSVGAKDLHKAVKAQDAVEPLTSSVARHVLARPKLNVDGQVRLPRGWPNLPPTAKLPPQPHAHAPTAFTPFRPAAPHPPACNRPPKFLSIAPPLPSTRTQRPNRCANCRTARARRQYRLPSSTPRRNPFAPPLGILRRRAISRLASPFFGPRVTGEGVIRAVLGDLSQRQRTGS